MRSIWGGKMAPFFLPILGLLVGISLGLLLAKIAGENPWHVFTVIVKSSFGSRYDVGVTLHYVTPLIFTGLSVAVAFHAGLFNIGAEGQLNLAAITTAIVGTVFSNAPPIFAPILAGSAGIFIGALWGWVPGWIRTKRGGHEVISTIMMNFISAAITSWLVTAYFQNPATQNPETAPIGEYFFFRSHDPLAHWFQDAPVSIAFLLAIAMAIFLWFVLRHTRFGFELRAVGENEHAAQVAGISVSRTRQWAMAMAGGLAGMVAIAEILGNAGRYRLGFSPEYGFVGIAVALLAQNQPIAIIFTALLFGALHKGAADLDIETEHITRDLSLVMQALVIFSVAIFSSIRRKR